MVNYCCVTGCGRNSRTHTHLKFYGLPKDRTRQKQWLKAAGKEDVADKDLEKLRRSIRFCSRHFLSSCLKNRYLHEDAMPTKSLPGSKSDDESEPGVHEGIVCDGCSSNIKGFRYKCVTCDNFDLCASCEMYQTHPQHYMLRIPKSLKFKVADNLINQWRSFFNAEHIIPGSCGFSSDDEPVTKYVKNYDSGLDLSEDTKKILRDEVDRALSCLRQKKIMKRDHDSSEEKTRSQNIVDEEEMQELAFADVSEYDTCEVKSETSEVPVVTDEQPVYFLGMTDDLTQLMIDNKNITYE